MKKTLIKFFLINLIYFALLFIVVTVGFEYDKANKLYPETVWFGHTGIGGVHGQRWVRLFNFLAPLGLLANLVVGFIWYRNRQRQSQVNLSITNE